MKNLIQACLMVLLLLLINHDRVMAQEPNALNVCQDSVDRIETLLSRFPKLANAGDPAPLYESVMCDVDSSRRYQIIELLLKYGANPNSRTEDGDRTPLGICNDSALAELLIKHGAKIDQEEGRIGETYFAPGSFKPIYRLKKGSGATPLSYAIYNLGEPKWYAGPQEEAQGWTNKFSKCLGVIRALIRHGANPKHDQTALYRMIDWIRGGAFSEEDMVKFPYPDDALLIVKTLVEAGAKVNERAIHLTNSVNTINDLDETPLAAAVRVRWASCVDYLISKGADVNFRDRNGDPILYHAIKDKQEWKDKYTRAGDDDEYIKTINDVIAADDEIISILRSHGAKEK